MAFVENFSFVALWKTFFDTVRRPTCLFDRFRYFEQNAAHAGDKSMVGNRERMAEI